MSANRNSSYKISTNYKRDNFSSSGYEKFKTQKRCVKQVGFDSQEDYGSFSLRAALRPPYGCGQHYCQSCDCTTGCGKCISENDNDFEFNMGIK
jgi:hypothetical protein